MRAFMQLCLLLLTVSLIGCGFHPRGKLHFSSHLKQMYLETSSEFTPLSQAIEQTLSENDIQLTQSPTNAKFVLKVFDESQSNSLMTLGANQETRQYELRYSIKFSLYNKSGRLILGPRKITETRTQIIQANQLLDNNAETKQLYNSMRSQSVIDLMYQLSAQKTTGLLNKNMRVTPSKQAQ